MIIQTFLNNLTTSALYIIIILTNYYNISKVSAPQIYVMINKNSQEVSAVPKPNKKLCRNCFSDMTGQAAPLADIRINGRTATFYSCKEKPSLTTALLSAKLSEAAASELLIWRMIKK